MIDVALASFEAQDGVRGVRCKCDVAPGELCVGERILILQVRCGVAEFT